MPISTNKITIKDTPKHHLRYGWTTGACATAATYGAYYALLRGYFPRFLRISLPNGEKPVFSLAFEELVFSEDSTEDTAFGKGVSYARAGVVKDAGDDPDVTHGVLVISRICRGKSGSGVVFRAGLGVGTVTRAGLPLAPGEPAINPSPRHMMCSIISSLAEEFGDSGDIEIEISIPGGSRLSSKTWNPRLGIVGGLSILGTTGIVRPYSCSAWIDSIRRGIDVSRAAGLSHIAGSTGSTSERAVRSLYGLPDYGLIDMGDFVGGMLKYLRRHRVARVTICGGFAKMCKLSQGATDLHSRRSEVDFLALSDLAKDCGGEEKLCSRISTAQTCLEVLQLAYGQKLSSEKYLAEMLVGMIAMRAREVCLNILRGADIDIEIVIVDRVGTIIGHARGW